MSSVVGVISKLNCVNCEHRFFGHDEFLCDITGKPPIQCHVLMWDFDNQQLSDIVNNLKTIQSRYYLSDIHILESNAKKGNYHAYCFTRTEWKHAIEIACATKGIDWDFVRLAVYRGNFTLRISDKLGNQAPNVVKRLEGLVMPDCSPEDLSDFVQYEIWQKGEKK